MLKVLLIDNYDSFTFNLVQLLRECGVEHTLTIVSNDTSPEKLPKHFDKILISPGPGLPTESGKLMELIAFFAGNVPMLGVCLGHQALALHFGAKLKQLKNSIHGMKKLVYLTSDNEPLFKGSKKSFPCGRYHSWVVDKEGLPEDLIVIATDKGGEIMAIKHRFLSVFGVQFHPESYMTQGGEKMIRNWLLQK